nr:hypothetical protein [uncultured Cardiobacterium sp.]
MPNWVANSVRCDNLEVLGKLRDFNRIIPMPLALEKTESGSNSGHYERLIFDGLTFRDIIQPENAPPSFLRFGQDDYGNTYNICQPMLLAKWLPLARRYHLCRSLYGYATWYDWCVDTGVRNGTVINFVWEVMPAVPSKRPGHILVPLSRRCHGNIRSWYLKSATPMKTSVLTLDAIPSKMASGLMPAGCLTAAAKPMRLLLRCGAVRKITAGMERYTTTSMTMTEQQKKRLRALFF